MKKIAVIPNYTKDPTREYTKRLLAYLSGKAVAVMKKDDFIDGVDAVFTEFNIYKDIDAVIVLGGDGTMLQAAEPCGRMGIPVMGINLGKVGFMTEVEVSDMEDAAERLISGDFTVEERMMTQITVKSVDSQRSFVALNDAVISKTDARMTQTELYAGGEKLSEYTSDGLIISTPTGSTGYSLSAGGPVADPTMQLFIATPICAHMLSARPMLISDKKSINVRLVQGGCETAILTVDGENKCKIGFSDTIEIQRWCHTLKIIKLGKQSFYYTMMAKL